jgi:tryptophan synthase alpha subunit
METRKQKIEKTRRLLDTPQTLLTQKEKEFVEKYKKKSGIIIVRNPNENEREMTDQLTKKGIEIIVIHRKTIGN